MFIRHLLIVVARNAEIFDIEHPRNARNAALSSCHVEDKNYAPVNAVIANSLANAAVTATQVIELGNASGHIYRAGDFRPRASASVEDAVVLMDSSYIIQSHEVNGKQDRLISEMEYPFASPATMVGTTTQWSSTVMCSPTESGNLCALRN